MSELKSELLRVLRRKSVMFGDFTLASGARSDFYVDCRLTTMDARAAWLIGELGWAAVKRAQPAGGARIEAIGGLTMGADPVALAIAMVSARDAESSGPIDAFSVRKTPKAHGRTRLIEGNFVAGMTVAVAEDVITTGGSALQAIDAIVSEGGRPAVVVALVDREEGGREAIEARGVPVVALTTRGELRQVW